ncbi:MAG: ribosome biogenesis GTP-binding protein YihA/YsxC [Xanthomonadaceae bacterium]|nr:ribosome biogenesis GTP-binding protein YihA/YsxC [Xanthomonadaceae bacterium]
MFNPFTNSRYLLSAHNLKQLPPDEGREIVFAGRSNAGKSSALNALSGRKGLARVSKTPGRTQQLVFFEVCPQRYLVDLPGYGYAKVPQALREHWRTFIDAYFQQRSALKALVIVMDIRHPLKEYDRQLLGYAVVNQLPVHALLTKADKLGRGAQTIALNGVRKEMATLFGSAASVQLFSSETGQGVEQARAVTAAWLGLTDNDEPPAPIGE